MLSKALFMHVWNGQGKPITGSIPKDRLDFSVGKQESMWFTIGSYLVCLVHLLLFAFNPQEQQINLHLLNMAMLGSHMYTNIGGCLLPLAKDTNLMPSLLALVEQDTEVLLGKALVLVTLLCKHIRKWLS